MPYLFVHLHSSMDRFEVLRVLRSIVSPEYLHSSMDRFEAAVIVKFFCTVNDLHSSMDRFEAVYKNHFAKLVEIYIPVWIDLKPHKSS